MISNRIDSRTVPLTDLEYRFCTFNELIFEVVVGQSLHGQLTGMVKSTGNLRKCKGGDKGVRVALDAIALIHFLLKLIRKGLLTVQVDDYQKVFNCRNMYINTSALGGVGQKDLVTEVCHQSKNGFLKVVIVRISFIKIGEKREGWSQCVRQQVYKEREGGGR